jgi:hypothetical protein
MRFAVLLVLALLAAPARADIGEGNWEMEITTAMPGMPPGGAPMRQQQCLRGEDGRDPQKLFGDPGAGCQFTDRTDTGSSYRFRIVCSGPTQVDGSGEMRYSHDAMDGQIVLNMSRDGQKVQTTTTIKARRTGPCAASR